MSASDDRKAKRRRQKKGPVAKTSAQNESTCQNIHETFGLANPSEDAILSPGLDSETMKKLEKLMDAKNDADIPHDLLSLSRGPNPFLDKERCLLCGCERIDPPEAAAIRAKSPEKKNPDTNALAQLPLWVCPDCRKSTEQGMDNKVNISSFMEEPDLPPEPSSLPFVDPALDSEPVSPNGTVCNCEACTERRQIEAEHDKETQELQNCWTELRKLVRMLYGRRDGEVMEKDESIPDEDKAKELVHRLCARDPHQLFLRLESQVREFVIEMKVKLLKQLNSGYKTPPEAKSFIQLLLDEYSHLCVVSRQMAEILTKLKNDHLAKFHLTWELHNKHLFQSIAYTELSIQSSLHLIISQLRLGAASKESYNEDTYPNLLHRYLKFDDEMSVISVVWRDSYQKIEQYNEEQSALKLKQKMLKEDWEFFKAQRKILEDHVAKNSKSPVSHSSFEAQFTETMRLMLQGSKPGPEECHCSRCNRKRCPCDECTITHMITCGIINPEALEASNPNHPSFLHDPNRYRIDVSPPSMSSTTSSSGSSSPILVEREPRIRSFDLDENLNDGGEEEEIQEEIENNSQSYEGDEADDDMEDEDEDDEDEDDDYDLDDDEDEEEEEDETEGDGDDEEELNVDTKKEDLTAELTEMSSKSWMNDPDDDGAVELISEKCDCYHCVSQAQAEQMIKLNENSCQCYVCLRQKGQTISTSLPQQVTTETSRPGELHLYPHIHGSAGLHGLANQHVRPLLPTQLYDLHMPPVRQPKPLLQTSTKVPLKLDFDSPEGIHEHIYHAYGEWDNTYDPRMLLPKYGTLGTDLLPPPPLTTNFSTTSFLTEPFSVGTQTFGDTLPSSTSATSAFKTSVNNQVSSTTNGSESTFVHNHDHTAPKVSRTESSSKNMTPPCTRPIPVGGNISQQKGGSVAGCGGDKLHSQHCRHHNSSLLNKNNNNFQAHNHTSNSSNLPVKVTQDFIQTAARNIRENAKEGMQMIRQFASSLNANVNNSHSCNHSLPNSQGHSHQASATGDQNHTGNCPNAVTMATTVNNVSVGTSTVCMDQDCEGHFEDNCDSVDDSCSEQSSSTSTSNQKEGKYCDCCYCEFFGHGNPPVAPTSKNYAEMRDRLRLRLKKKNEARQEDGVTHSENCIARNNYSKNQRQLESQGLDELIKYINGTDQKDSQNFEKSSKAAKRARQKQRKAEEKARLEAEKLQEELERKEREKEKNLANTAKLENLKNNQKKKKRKEKMKSDENVQETKDARIVREPPLGKEDDTREKRSKSRNSSKKDVVTQSEDKEIHARISCGNTQKISVMSSASASVVNTQQTLDQRMNCHLTPAKSKSCVTSTVNSAPKENGNIVSEKCRIIEGSAKNADRNDTKSSNNSHSKSRTNEESEQMQRKGKNVSKLSNSYNKSKTNEESEQVQKKGKRLNEASPCIKNHVIEPSLKSQSPKPEQSTNKPQQVQKQLSQLRQNDLQSKNGTHQQISKQTLPQNAVKQQPQNNKQQVNNSFKQTSPSVKQQVVQQPGKAQPAKQPQGNLSKSQNTQSPQPQTKGNSNQYSNSKVQQLQPTTPQGKVQSPQVTPKTDPHQHTKNVQQGSKASTNLHTQNKLSFQQFLQSPANCSKQSMSFTPAPQQSPRQVQQSPKSTQQRSAVIQNGSHTLKPQEKTSVVKGGVLGPVVENGVNSGLKHSSGTSSVSTPQQSRTSPDGHRTDKNKNKQEDSPPSNDQKGTRSKKNKKKNRNSEDLTTVIDEIFLPKDISEAEHGDMDDVEKELEEFKRFCLDSTPVKREKLQVNMNLKDIFVKKKSGLGCS